jgi:hypothetical protein
MKHYVWSNAISNCFAFSFYAYDHTSSLWCSRLFKLTLSQGLVSGALSALFRVDLPSISGTTCCAEGSTAKAGIVPGSLRSVSVRSTAECPADSVDNVTEIVSLSENRLGGWDLLYFGDKTIPAAWHGYDEPVFLCHSPRTLRKIFAQI